MFLGQKNGSIDATVTGGTVPYTYKWSNKATTEDISGQPAGYYVVHVMDADSTVVTADITLTQPLALKVSAVPFEYPNGFHVSCLDCFNGSIDVTVLGGVAPYSYAWRDGTTTEDRSGLGAAQYAITATDDNGCATTPATIILTQPKRESWDMGGNAGIDPEVHFLGTSDSADLVLKSGALSIMRLESSGEVKLLGALTGEGPLYRKLDGTLRSGLPVYDQLPGSLCRTLGSFPYWQTTGNSFSQLCPEEQPLLGTLQAMPLRIVTNGLDRVVVAETGEVGIGTTEPAALLHVHGDLLVRDGVHGDIVSSSSASTGPVLWARNDQAAWGLSVDATGKGHIIGDWNDPRPVMTFAYDKVGIGTDNMPNDDYSLFVGKGILAERVKVALQTSSEWSDHVFQPGYRLLPLKDVAAFVKEHGHLPGVPSADQMVEQGLDVVKTDAMLLEKIEELTLYMIAANERLAEVEAENARLRTQLKEIDGVQSIGR